MDDISTYNSIYENVFCKTFNQSCYIFLCGGADKNNIRNSVKNLLSKKQFQILYPEDLFMEMLNRDKRSDLLEYENFLADNADVICIICESMGSAVELGAFVQNENIRKKLVVAINQKYSRDKSFIMMGPVKHLCKNHPDHLVTYKPDHQEELVESLCKLFRKLHKRHHGNKNNNFSELSAYIAFIPIIVYFYKTVGRKQLHKNLKAFLNHKGMQTNKYNELFNVAIKYLLKTNVLVTRFDQNKSESIISLSGKGYQKIQLTLNNSVATEKTLLHDRIRCDILKEQLNK